MSSSLSDNTLTGWVSSVVPAPQLPTTCSCYQGWQTGRDSCRPDADAGPSLLLKKHLTHWRNIGNER